MPWSDPPAPAGTRVLDSCRVVAGPFATMQLGDLLADTGEPDGPPVKVGTLDVLASLLTFNAGIHFATGASPRRRGNAHPPISPHETVEAADGWLDPGMANEPPPPVGPAPRLSEHRDELLCEWPGLDRAAVEALARQGAIGAAA